MNKLQITIGCLLAVSSLSLVIFHQKSNSLGRAKRSPKCLNNGTWHDTLNACVCDHKWIGRTCSIWKHQTCYFGDGHLYRGQLSLTKSGMRCSSWTTDSNNNLHPLGKDGIGVHNHCRNPDKDVNGLWCYVDGLLFVDYCNATRCPESYKNLPNITSTGTTKEGEGNNTILVLYGPLISGICGGVVALMIFIGVGEYLRRRGHCTKTAPKKRNMKSKLIQNNNLLNHKDKALPLGGEQQSRGIVTVNLDTGEQKRQSGRLKPKDTNACRDTKKDDISVYSVATVNSAKSKASLYNSCPLKVDRTQNKTNLLQQTELKKHNLYQQRQAKLSENVDKTFGPVNKTKNVPLMTTPTSTTPPVTTPPPSTTPPLTTPPLTTPPSIKPKPKPRTIKKVLQESQDGNPNINQTTTYITNSSIQSPDTATNALPRSSKDIHAKPRVENKSPPENKIPEKTYSKPRDKTKGDGNRSHRKRTEIKNKTFASKDRYSNAIIEYV